MKYKYKYKYKFKQGIKTMKTIIVDRRCTKVQEVMDLHNISEYLTIYEDLAGTFYARISSDDYITLQAEDLESARVECINFVNETY